MIEQLFGAGAPMWTSSPPAGFASQAPVAFGNSPIATPIFGAAQAPSLPLPLPRTTPPYVGPESFVPLTAASLLTAVAIRRGQPQGPTNDQEVEDFIYDALELLTGTGDVEVRCDGGRVTLTGSVQHKRLKRDVGEIAWAIPAVNDVQNNVTIASRRRTRGANRENEPASGAQGKK
jgi:BON domain